MVTRMTAACLFALTTTLAAQAPQIQNGQVETRRVADLARDVETIARSATEPVWVGWREAGTPRMGNACCWSDWSGDQGQRGCQPEPVPPTAGSEGTARRPQFAPPSGPTRLEGGTDVIVMVRLVDKAVERVRAYSDDCPLDAGSRKVVWLEGVSAAGSVNYLLGLVSLADRPELTAAARRRLNNQAISAIGYHRDSAVDALIALTKQREDAPARSSAFSALGRSGDPRAFAYIESILKR